MFSSSFKVGKGSMMFIDDERGNLNIFVYLT